jgi:hypothetical protein
VSTTYPDHHDGIVGRQLNNNLLGLDDRAQAHREAIRALAFHLQDATGVGNPAPVVARMGERLRSPVVGDLVVETSTRRRQTDLRIESMGYLLATREEWYDSEADWAALIEEYPEEDTDDNRSTDTAWYVQYGPDPRDVCRWVNCSFLVIPIEMDSFSLPAGRPTETGGVVFTRDTLLTSLADSGFTLNPPNG